MYLSVAILRLDKGLDYSQILGEEIPSNMYDTSTKPLPSNDSSADLLSDKNVHGSSDSLGRTISQGIYKCNIIHYKTCTHTHTGTCEKCILNHRHIRLCFQWI